MSAITYEVAVQHRDAWLAASMALATAQEYQLTVGTTSRRLTRTDASEVRKWLEYWETRVVALAPAGERKRRVRFGVPL